jgi:hypothetical protein
VRRATTAAALAALALSACGSSSGGGETPGSTPAASAGNAPAAPQRPTAADCDASQLRTTVHAGDLIPPSGGFAYRVQGKRQVLGAAGGETSLPARTQFSVGPVLRAGKLACFAVQRRYTPEFVDTGTFVVRGSDVYLTKLDIFGAGNRVSIAPSPPVKTLDGASLSWSGSFGGPTRGQFSGTTLGRRTIRLGGQRVHAIGVELRLAFAGDVQGTARTETWLSLKRNVVLSERAIQDRTIGGDHVKLDYTATLEPTAAALKAVR